MILDQKVQCQGLESSAASIYRKYRLDIDISYRLVTPADLSKFSIYWYQFLGAMQICIARTSYGNVAGWLAGWLSVTAGTVSKRLNLS